MALQRSKHAAVNNLTAEQARNRDSVFPV